MYLQRINSSIGDVRDVRRPNPGCPRGIGASFEDTGAEVQDAVCVGSVVPNAPVSVRSAGPLKIVSSSLSRT
jgi:hypothetical protein